MRLFPLLCLCLLPLCSSAQWICVSDSSTVFEFPGTAVPPLVGEASFASGHYKIIVGGKFLDPKNPAAEAVYNCDMVILDAQADKTYVLPLGFFPPFVSDQFSGVNYCYTSDQDTAYLLGGYGYDLARAYETTFPTLTIFPIKTLIDSVIQHKDYLGLFEAITDEEHLAITEGTLVRLDGYFLVYNGKEIKPEQEDEFSDEITMNEWDFRGQLRKFTLARRDDYREVAEFQICNTSKVFYQCMPSKGKPTPPAPDDKH
ncbi:MAG TPA: hypothetical protein PK971_11575 [Saprospiraceae bacterium]|nr:hypothetical protein [Saprospiraceae bacterium]HNG88980.1 hypothetical protein [Saprospiraceae bacterium]